MFHKFEYNNKNYSDLAVYRRDWSDEDFNHAVDPNYDVGIFRMVDPIPITPAQLAAIEQIEAIRENTDDLANSQPVWFSRTKGSTSSKMGYEDTTLCANMNETTAS